MTKPPRKLLHRHLPGHYRNPVGLAWRLVKSKRREAYFAMSSTLAGLLLTPLDLLLLPFERKAYRRAEPPRHPVILVCGPPRSGTTLVAQTLIRYLGTTYINNLTALFPRSPVTANRILPGCMKPDRVRPRSYYGRTSGLAGTNDGLQLWDRWFGRDRTRIPTALSSEERDAMVRFFGACEQAFGGPLIAKNNSLNLSAALVAEIRAAMPSPRWPSSIPWSPPGCCPPTGRSPSMRCRAIPAAARG